MGTKQANRRDQLLDKLKAKTISQEEAKELKAIMEEEKKSAETKQNTILALGIAFILGLIAVFLGIDDDENEKKSKSKKSNSDPVSKALDDLFD